MYAVEYPQMSLYQEIILLQYFFRGLYVVENVKPYYTPLITPSVEMDRHLFWANYKISKYKVESNYIFSGKDKKRVSDMLGFDLSGYNIEDKTKVLRNCVHPDLGLHIFNCALQREKVTEQLLFTENIL